MWELLNLKNVNTDVITTSDLKRYKHIVELTNAHLVGYEPGGDIQISRGSKFTKVISKLSTEQTSLYSNGITASLGGVLDGQRTVL